MNHSASMNKYKISVVIIGRNEEQHIERSIRSVIKGTEQIKNREIVYVDSASEDNTIQIAEQFPVKIVQLKPEWPLSPSAGRYIGYLNTSGDFIFFVDGDTVIYKSWLNTGIEFLEKNKNAAGIAGMVHELFVDRDDNILGFMKNRYHQKNHISEVKLFGGISLFRRSVLDLVGPFNPFIVADEERELGLRIRKAGYKLVRISHPMAITYADSRETIPEIMRRSGSNLYNFGKTLRYCQNNGLFFKYLVERFGFIFTFILSIIAVLFVLIFSVIIKKYFVFLIFFVIISALSMIKKKGNIRSMFVSFIKRFVITFKTIQSYIRADLKPVESYPTDVIVVKE
jgi:glycosyltransferase involved in cell wall biosynthesis